MSRAEILPEPKPWPVSVEPVSIKGVRYYRLPTGELAPSVTSVEKAANYGSADNLFAWYEKNGKEAAIEAAVKLFTYGAGMSEDNFRAAIETEIKGINASRRKMEKAADIGTLVHAAIQYRMKELTGETPGIEPKLTDEAWLAFTAWEEWWDVQGLTPVVAEQFIYHEALGYAGCIDLIAEGEHGLEILDWKSSNYILGKHHVQVAAYKHAAECFRPIARARIVRVPKTLANIEIEVRELGDVYNMTAKAHEQYTEERLLRAFLGGLQVHKVFFAS